MDRGSAQYTSFECRNNVAPVHKSQCCIGAPCLVPGHSFDQHDWYSPFNQYLSHPTDFFMRRFAGMTLLFANFLI
ncbi:hypothetical protein BJV78DRAFT_1238547 [Lactifluus subvellereus]|nr:hypothetical protein BJV78DRAFT_1238547 [Lactifluus subvellereus]